jgi:hypothetical protein
MQPTPRVMRKRMLALLAAATSLSAAAAPAAAATSPGVEPVHTAGPSASSSATASDLDASSKDAIYCDLVAPSPAAARAA